MSAVADIRGLKRICTECGTRFYDMNKRPIVCPNCSAEFSGEIKVKSRRGRGAASDDAEGQVSEAQAKASNDDDEDDELEDDEEAQIVSLDDLETTDGNDDDEDDDDDLMDLDDDDDIGSLDDIEHDADIDDEDDDR